MHEIRFNDIHGVEQSVDEKHEKATGKQLKDQSYLLGKRIGRLTVIDVFREGEKKRIMCKCLCDCGNTYITSKRNLLHQEGTDKSCGCALKEKRHGMSRTRIYSIYRGMKQRCYAETCSIYHKYGAIGIKMAPEWLGPDGFKNFLQWSMNRGYRDDLTIDRINPKGNYTPDNCRWATYEQQNTHLSMLKNNRSGIVGVSWSKKENRWIAMISINNKVRRIGSFMTKEAAAEARNNFIKENGLPHQLAVIPSREDEQDAQK